MRIARQRRPNADAVIRALGQLEIETQNEIRVLRFCEQVALVIRRRKQHAVFDQVAGATVTNLGPAFKGLAVKQIDEPGFGRRRASGCTV
jgi:hypothetical protein